MVDINDKRAQAAQLVDLPHELTVEILKKAIAGSSPEELGKTLVGTALASKTLLEAAASAPIVALDTAVDLADAGAAHVALKHFQTKDKAARDSAHKLLLASPRVVGNALRSRDPSAFSAKPLRAAVWDAQASTQRLASLAGLVREELAELFAPAASSAGATAQSELAALAAAGPWEALARALATAAPEHADQAHEAMCAAAEAGQLDCLKLLFERFPYAQGFVNTAVATAAALAGHRDCFVWALKHLNPAASPDAIASAVASQDIDSLYIAGLGAFGPEGLDSLLATFPEGGKANPSYLAVAFFSARAELDEELRELRAAGPEAQAAAPGGDEPARAGQVAALAARRARLQSGWPRVEAESLARLEGQGVRGASKSTLRKAWSIWCRSWEP